MSRNANIWKRDTWVLPLLKKHRKAFLLALALSVGVFIFASALMFTSGYMISLAAAIPLTVLALHVPSIFVRIFGIGKPLLRYAERLVSHDWVLRMTSQMRQKLYDVLNSQAVVSRPSKTLGQVIELLTEDIGHVQNVILRSILPLLSAWLLCLIIFVVSGILSLEFLILMVVFLVVTAVAIPLLSASLNSLRIAKMQQLQHELYEDVTDNIYGIADWVLSDRKDDYLAHSNTNFRQRQKLQDEISRFNRRCDIILQVLFGLLASGVLVWASLVFGSGELQTSAVQAIASVGSENSPAYAANWIAAFVLCIFPLMEAFAPLPRAAMDYKRQIGTLEHLNDLSSSQGPRCDTQAQGNHAKIKPAISTTPNIDVQNVFFSYSERKPFLLKDISLSVPYSQKIAILGRSGVGKSTLISLLYGELKPSSGSICIGGMTPDSKTYAMSEVIGMVQQYPQLLKGTLRDNLLIGNPSASDAELIDALCKVGLDIGLDAIVSESGVNFSGGERHRIALARILLADQSIVILDEPFTGLDPKTEKLLLDSFLDALSEKTVIVVTHHLTNIHRFDRVIFIQEDTNGEGVIASDDAVRSTLRVAMRAASEGE